MFQLFHIEGPVTLTNQIKMTSSKNAPAGTKIAFTSETSNWSANELGTLIRWVDDTRAFVTVDGRDYDEYVAFPSDFVAFVPVK